MPVTRGQSQGQGRSRLDVDDDEASEGPEGSVSAPSRLNYDLRELSPSTTQRVRAAWTNRFVVEIFKEFHSEQRDEYFAVQITEPRKIQYSVRIGSPASGYGEMQCSCKSPKPCQHIFWLVDQIAQRSVPDSVRGSTLKFSPQGVLQGAPDAYSQIKHVGVTTLTDALNCRLSVEESDEGSPEIIPASSKLWMIRDMLAVFSTETPDEYRPDLFNDLPVDVLAENALVKKDLERTLARVLLMDDDVFECLQSVVSTEYCAIDFFDKMEKKAVSAMVLMDHCRPPGRNESREIHDVEWCAKTLDRIVESIRTYPLSRKLSLSRVAKEQAARSLVLILENVVDRNQDMYAGNEWRNTRQRATPIDTHNLLQKMVGSSAGSVPRPFILDQLGDLAEATYSMVYTLDEIFVKVRSSNAPSIYISRLEKLIQRLKSESDRGAGEPSGIKRSGTSSGKRSAPPPKRMK
ncbi:MAG: hypothetical protein M1818_001629 [Claussenomyces sp. TS43310]|nr:MAG: hypothetical protein M1818_001629 [Claussenomyces sp. TS43310]